MGGPLGQMVCRPKCLISSPCFHTSLYMLFQLMWHAGYMHPDWMHTETILPQKKDPPTHLPNRRPLGLGNTLTRLWSRYVASILMAFSLDFNVISPSQEGFRPGRDTACLLQRLVNLIEDSSLHSQNLYVLFVDFSSAFNTILHDRLFTIMQALGFPADAVAIVRAMYSVTTTSVVVSRRTRVMTPPIPIGRGTIQGDCLSPLLFVLYMEPLLRWLKEGNRGYTPVCAPSLPQTTYDYADDLSLVSRCFQSLLLQFNKLLAYCTWAGLTLNPAKCAVTGILHGHARTGHAASPVDRGLLRSQLENRFTTPVGAIPFLAPENAYKVLGIPLTMTLDWRPHLASLLTTVNEQGQRLLQAGLQPQHALAVLNRVIRPKLTCKLAVAPFTPADIHKLDQPLARLARACLNLPKTFPTRAVLLPRQNAGIGAHSLMLEYTQSCARHLTRSLNDPGELGILSHALLFAQRMRMGDLPGSHTVSLAREHPMAVRQLSILQAAGIHIHTPAGPIQLQGNSLWQELHPHPPWMPLPITDKALTHILLPLFRLGIHTMSAILEHFNGAVYIIPADNLKRAYLRTAPTRALHEARRALNQLTLLLAGAPQALQHNRVGPLALHQRRVTCLTAFLHKLPHAPQPGGLELLATLRSWQNPRPVPSPLTLPIALVPPDAQPTLAPVASDMDYSAWSPKPTLITVAAPLGRPAPPVFPP